MRNIQVLTAFAGTGYMRAKTSQGDLKAIMERTAQMFKDIGQTPEGQIVFKALKGNDIVDALTDGIAPQLALGAKRGISFPTPKGP